MVNKNWITNIYTMQHMKYAIILELYNQQLKLRRNEIQYTVASRYVEVKMTTISVY